MKLIHSLVGASALAFCGTALGQTIIYSEDFSGGDVPAGWFKESFGGTTTLTNPSSFLNLESTPNDGSTNWVNGIHYNGDGLNNLNFTDTNLANYTFKVELRSPDAASGRTVRLELRSRDGSETGRLRRNVDVTDTWQTFEFTLADAGWDNPSFAGSFNITDPRFIVRLDIGKAFGWGDGDGATTYELEVNSFEFSAIPEPSSYGALLGVLALCSVIVCRRRG
jgi:hypothetical protein